MLIGLSKNTIDERIAALFELNIARDSETGDHLFRASAGHYHLIVMSRQKAGKPSIQISANSDDEAIEIANHRIAKMRGVSAR